MRKPSGNWKIAYADFITSMMILFLMLWITASVPQEDLEKIGNYFKKPFVNFSSQYTEDPILKKDINDLDKQGFMPGNSIQSFNMQEIELEQLSYEDRMLFSNLLETIKVSQILQEYPDNVHFYWRDGLVIEVLDSYNRPLFKDLTDEINLHAIPIIKKVIQILQHQRYYITIDGHAILKSNASIDPWLLSFQRANQIRKYMEKYLGKSRIVKVNANSDKDLIDAKSRNNPNNMRITITLLNSESLKKQYLAIPKKFN